MHADMSVQSASPYDLGMQTLKLSYNVPGRKAIAMLTRERESSLLLINSAVIQKGEGETQEPKMTQIHSCVLEIPGSHTRHLHCAGWTVINPFIQYTGAGRKKTCAPLII